MKKQEANEVLRAMDAAAARRDEEPEMEPGIFKHDDPETERRCRESVEEMLRNDGELPPKSDEIFDLMTSELEDYYDADKIALGIETIDGCLGSGLMRGTLTTIAGPEGNGKTTIALQVAAAQAKAGKKIMIYSAEMPLGAIKNIMAHQMARDGGIHNPDEDALFPRYIVKQEEVEWLSKAYAGRISCIIPRIDAFALTRFKEQLAAAAKTGTEVFILDNQLTITDLIAADPSYKGAGDNTLQAAAAVWAAGFAAQYNVWVIMIAHTRKENSWQAQNRNDTISGSSALKNLSSAIVFFDKLPEEQRLNDLDTTDRCVALTKNRYFGRLKTAGVRTVYNEMNMTVSEKEIEKKAE